MESDRAEGYVGLTKDEERLIYICNYYSQRLLSLKECREMVDAKMAMWPIKPERGDE